MRLLESIKSAFKASKNPLEYLGQAQARFSKGDYAGAIADFNQALQHGIKPNFNFFAGRGSSYFSIGDMKAAIADLSKAIELDKSRLALAVRHIRGCAYQHESQYDAAINDFNEVLAHKQGDFDAYFQRGRAYFCKREF